VPLVHLIPQRARRLVGRAIGALPEAVRVQLVRELAVTTRDGLPDLVRRLVEGCLRGADADAAQAVFAALDGLAAGDSRSIDYGLTCGRNLVETVRGLGVRLEGARVVELGPGYTLGTGLAFLALGGAARWSGVDVAPLATRRAAPYRRARERIAAGALGGDAPALLARFDAVVDLSGETARFDPARVSYHAPADAARLPLEDGACDLLVSNAALEHVHDPAAVLRESFRVLVPGGLGVHQIDLRDHRDFTRPRAFLQLDDATWRAGFDDASNHEHTNRWRKGDFERALRAAGFVIERADVSATAPIDRAERARLDARFRDLPDAELEALSVLFVVRRP
jgi:SAM-dependent methyltransferase